MKRIITASAASLLLLANTAQAAESGVPQETVQAKAHRLAETLVSDYGVSGVQYAIRDEGKVVLSGSAGVADRATGAAVTKDTMFGIGSVSKMYVTAAAMQLAERKQIDLDQPLVAYLPEFTMADTRYKKITPRMLMNHSSGLYGTHYANSMLFDDNDTLNRDELLQRLRSEKLKSDPGEYSVYCNDGFQLLELLVERISGMSYSQYIDQHFSQPLELSSTKTPLDQFDRAQLAKAYYPAFKQALPAENANVIGAGGLYSTAEEVTEFGEALIGNRPEVLSAQSAAALKQPEYKNGVWVPEASNSYNFGLGWDAVSLSPFEQYGIQALTKGGDTIVYHAALTSLPEHDLSIAVLSSGGSSMYNTTLASSVLLEYLQDKGTIKRILPDTEFKPAVQAAMPSELQAYSGLYGTVGSTLELKIKDGQLELPGFVGGLIPAESYVYTGDGKFKNKKGNAAVSFDKQSNGKTYLKLNATVEFPGLGQSLMVTYEYQKLASSPLNAAAKAAWQQRNGKKYYALDEKINSLFYLSPSILIKTIAVASDHGYASGAKIIDGQTAVNAVEIPVMTGRDAFDLNFHTVNDTEYLSIDGLSYISEDAVHPVYQGPSSRSTIQAEGQAVWFTIDKHTANKTMTVKVPANGGFVVYDKNGAPVSSSSITHTGSAVLPEGGLIVFGGDAGAVFEIGIKKQQ